MEGLGLRRSDLPTNKSLPLADDPELAEVITALLDANEPFANAKEVNGRQWAFSQTRKRSMGANHPFRKCE